MHPPRRSLTKQGPERKRKPRRRRPLEELRPAQRTFCLAYLANGFNATQAYRTAHPTAKPTTARVEGCRALTDPSVRAYLEPRLEDGWKRQQMGGEEAFARVCRDARADLRDLYDLETGKLLEPHLWPDSIAGSVRSVQDGPYGLKVTLVDGLAARRIVLEKTKVLKPLGDSVDALAEAIRADLEAHKERSE